ncbi:MAG TPA: TerB family tellurite resistance protein [Ignavibacteriaceae bacterium]|nr:TerB family tellurite resistance protein [Ignavibacteriaceae bacterium]
MFEYLRKVLSPERDEQVLQGIESSSTKSTSKKYKVATAALLVEIAKADGDFSGDERKRIIDLMKKDYDLDDECVNELLALSEQKVKDSVSIYEFSSVINESFTQQEKLDLIKNLWRIIYEDGKLNSHEDRLIKIIGSTLNLEHKDIIAAKLFVKREMGK